MEEWLNPHFLFSMGVPSDFVSSTERQNEKKRVKKTVKSFPAFNILGEIGLCRKGILS